jgi:hypothetical protein
MSAGSGSGSLHIVALNSDCVASALQSLALAEESMVRMQGSVQAASVAVIALFEAHIYPRPAALEVEWYTQQANELLLCIQRCTAF